MTNVFPTKTNNKNSSSSALREVNTKVKRKREWGTYIHHNTEKNSQHAHTPTWSHEKKKKCLLFLSWPRALTISIVLWSRACCNGSPLSFVASTFVSTWSRSRWTKKQRKTKNKNESHQIILYIHHATSIRHWVCCGTSKEKLRYGLYIKIKQSSVLVYLCLKSAALYVPFRRRC